MLWYNASYFKNFMISVAPRSFAFVLKFCMHTGHASGTFIIAEPEGSRLISNCCQGCLDRLCFPQSVSLDCEKVYWRVQLKTVFSQKEIVRLFFIYFNFFPVSYYSKSNMNLCACTWDLNLMTYIFEVNC